MAHNLPIQLTPFVGRARELAELGELLCNPACRLLTLAGPGGIGKTRLALQVAARAEAAFADGVVYVDLQALSDPQLLPSTIAQTLDLALGGAGELEIQLARFLAPLHLLLVLDNFEQLLDAAPLLSMLLTTCPDLRCLVTSREVLKLQEEWLFAVEGLEIGDDLSGRETVGDAVQLFAARARRVHHPFDPSAELTHVVEICRLSGGMPLAIELAAAWTKSLSCAAIVAEMRRSLAFLTTTLRNVPARHRSVHAALYASWERLSAAEQTVFCRLAVFQGGFPRAAAEEIAGANLAVLTMLVERSLVRWDPNRGRYMLHELIRQYAAERLAALPDEEQAAYNAHCRYFTEFLHARMGDLDGQRQGEAVREICVEYDNVRLAWDRALETCNLEAMHKSFRGYCNFCDLQGRYRESLEVTGRAIAELERVGEARPLLAHILALQGFIFIRTGELDGAVRQLERSEGLYTELGIAPIEYFGSDPLCGIGLVAHIRGDYARAIPYIEAARLRNEAAGDLSNLQVTLFVLANAELALGELKAATAHAQQAHRLSVACGHRWFMAYLLALLADIARTQQDYMHARRYYEDAYALKAELDDPEGMAVNLNHLGRIAWLEGSPQVAQEFHTRSLAIYNRIDDPGGLATSLLGLGNACAALGRMSVAIEHYRQGVETARRIGYLRLIPLLLADGAQILADAGLLTAARALVDGACRHQACDYETQQQATQIAARLPSPTSADPAAPSPPQLEDLDALIDIFLDALAGLEALARAPIIAANHGLIEPLTPRELEVLHLLASGHTNPEIASQLIISVGTVKFYTGQIFSKLAVHNRTRAVVRARELSLL